MAMHTPWTPSPLRRSTTRPERRIIPAASCGGAVRVAVPDPADPVPALPTPLGVVPGAADPVGAGVAGLGTWMSTRSVAERPRSGDAFGRLPPPAIAAPPCTSC